MPPAPDHEPPLPAMTEPSLHLAFKDFAGDRRVVSPGEELTFTVTWADLPAGHSTTGSIQAGTPQRELRSFDIPKDSDSTTITGITYDAEHGTTYTAVIALGHPPLTSELSVSTQPPAKPPTDPTEGGNHVIDVEPGQYDGGFALLSGLALLLLSVIVLNAFWDRWPKFELSPSTLADGRAVDTKAEQGFLFIAMLAVAIAAVLLIAGTWLGALETRGRLTVRIPVPGNIRSADREAADAAIENADKILGRLTLMRGTIAVISAGIAILLMALASSCQVAVSSHGAAAPTSSSPAAPATSSPTSTTASTPTDATPAPARS